MNPASFEIFAAALRVGEKRIAAIDDDVAFFEKGSELADDRVDRRTGLDHDHCFPRFLERADEFLHRPRWLNIFAFGFSVRELLRHLPGSIEHSDGEPFRFHVENEVLAHHGQADEANITLICGHFVFVASARELHCNQRFKGMANSVSQVLLTKAPLEAPKEAVDPSTSLRTSLAAGAVVDFWGIVRQLEEGHEIEGIDYEAHEAMAEHQMKVIADAAAETFRLNQVLLHHRIGFVPAGEASLFLRVRAQHRAAAFEASKWIVDELKKKVPIWKKPKFRMATQRHASRSEAATAK